MKPTQILLIALLITLPLQAQDITNKLGGDTATETYDVTDSGDNVLFRVQGDADALFNGTWGTGTIPASGSGVRMMWYPSKGAFRVGRVGGQFWDDSNIGLNSTAMGYNTTASGSSSTAMGTSTTATGSNSTALGVGIISDRATQTVVGTFNEASDDNEVFVVGCGWDNSNRDNAFEVIFFGDITAKNNVYAKGMYIVMIYGPVMM